MNNAKRLTFDSIKVNQTEHLFGDSSKPYCNLIINISYPTMADNAILKDTINHAILDMCFGHEYSSLETKTAVKNYITDYLNNYRRELEPTFKQESDSSVMQWYNYYRSIIGKVKYEKGNLLSYQMDYNEYTGGAHNIYSSNFENYNLKKMVTLKLADLFVANYQNTLKSLIIQQLIKDKEVNSEKELNEKGYGTTGAITPTENFFLDDDGITFVYNIYEIAPFSMGMVKVHLDYKQIDSIMNKIEFQELGLINKA
jgi:hypothetical protein